ncbi:MAG: hypothetical protein JWO06_1143, partial [Bacteroidota bacterium]|nr:hypothetical protein [Bacteroidota bacterium]
MKKLLLLFLTCFLGLIGFAQETFDMPNATGTYLTGINDSGEICGYYTVASGNTIAFEINKYGDTITINPGSYSFCTVTGISNKGMLVGNYGSASNTAAAQGFIFLPNPGRNAGGIYNTTVTGSWGGTNMTASGITDDTCIAGSYQVGSNDDGALWCNSYSQVTDLRCNNQGTVFPTYLFDLDKNGNVGGFIIQGAQEQAAIYRGVSLGWDTFVVGGSIKSRVYGMNDNGWICGTFNNQTKGYYAQKLPGQNLAHLTQIYVKGSTTVFPFHINNNNEIIGYYTDNLGVDHGFIVAKYDIGFRPSVNAYSFVNLRTGVFPDSYTDQFQYNTDPYLNNGSTFPKNGANVWSKRVFPDWPDFVKSMAESGFYKMSHGTKVIDHIAYGIWSASASLTFSGSCFGLSNTAAQIFDKRSWYLGLFPDCAAFNGLNVYSYPLNDTTITAISQTQYKQWSKVYSAHQAAHQQDALAVTMQSLKQSLRNSRGRPHSVLIINIQNTGASHAVLPFKLVPGFQGNGIDTIYIYDSNFPGQDNLYVTVDMNSGSTGRFHYTAAGQIVDWGIGLFGDGLWMRGIDTMDLATQYVKSKHGDSPIYSRSNPLIQSYFNDSCKVHMTDDNDSVAVMSTDSNAATALITPMNNFSGVAGRQAIGAFSTSGITRVNKLTNSTFASNFLMVTDYTSLIRCDRISGTDTSDDYAFSQGSLTYINNDAANRGVAFT